MHILQCFRRLLPASLLLGVGPLSHADPVDDVVAQEMKDQHIPGLALAVVKDGKVLKAHGYGWADAEAKVPVQPKTVFQLQSITKAFTATGIMLLVEEDKIRLDQPIGAYLEGLPDPWGRITVRHLLTHTSGIKDFINEPTVDLKKDITAEGVIHSLAGLPLNFPPGEKYSYSNSGYHLLGMILRRVTGKSWSDFLQERIFTPLGMADTALYTPSLTASNRAQGYGWENGERIHGSFIAPSILGYAGGGLLSTVIDLAKWDGALSSERILRRATLEQMWTPARLNGGSKSSYGFGWGVGDLRGHRFVNHSGAHSTGFRTTFLRFVDDHLTVVILANLRGANPEEIANRVAESYVPALRLSALPENVSIDPALIRNLRTSLTALAAREDSPSLAPEFRAEFQRNPALAAKLTERLQGMKSFGFLACEEVAGRGVERSGLTVRRVCHCKMVTGGETRYYTFYLTDDDRVALVQSSL